MHSTTCGALRSELEETRQRFYALAAELSADDWRRPTSNPAWNVGEMMFHITVAARFLPGDVWLIRRLGRVMLPPAWVFHRLNELVTRRMGRRYTHMTISQAYDEAHAAALRALETIRESDWAKSAVYPGWDPLLSGRVTLADLFHYVARHFDHHAAEIRAAIAPRAVSAAPPTSQHSAPG